MSYYLDQGSSGGEWIFALIILPWFFLFVLALLDFGLGVI
jgi:hypothetical protein